MDIFIDASSAFDGALYSLSLVTKAQTLMVALIGCCLQGLLLEGKQFVVPISAV